MFTFKKYKGCHYISDLVIDFILILIIFGPPLMPEFCLYCSLKSRLSDMTEQLHLPPSYSYIFLSSCSSIDFRRRLQIGKRTSQCYQIFTAIHQGYNGSTSASEYVWISTLSICNHPKCSTFLYLHVFEILLVNPKLLDHCLCSLALAFSPTKALKNTQSFLQTITRTYQECVV